MGQAISEKIRLFDSGSATSYGFGISGGDLQTFLGGTANQFSWRGAGYNSSVVMALSGLGALSLTGTALPTQAAGTLGLGGISSAPTLTANGEGDIYLDTTNGLTLIGQGSSNDFQFLNRNGTTVCFNNGGTAQFACGRISVTGSAIATNGMYLPSASTLGLSANNTSVVQMTSTTFVLQTGIAFTAPSTVNLPGLSTGTNADFLCLSAGGVVLLQTSACTISSMRFKNLIAEVEPREALKDVLALKPMTFVMKPREVPNRDWNFDQPQVGLTAENVASVNRKLAIYEQDGETPKSYRQEAIIAELVGAVQAQQELIESIQKDLRR